MTREFPRIPEWRDVDRGIFRNEIVPAGRPALLRGLVKDWPAVKAAQASSRAMADYLQRFDRGRPMEVLLGPPQIKGRFFYREDMRGLNFERRPAPFAGALEKLLEIAAMPEPPALYIQSAPVAENIPAFADENRNPLLDSNVGPRIWVGNALIVQTHFDLNDNIACLVAGKRRFTLFPPEQMANLYVGPFDFTLSGPPVSMASLEEPDFDKHPRFAEALEHAQIADLEPGDAIYIPYFWWHHVRSIEPFNVLINYWWNDHRPAASPFDCLLHGVLALRDLPEHQRNAWRALIQHYVFDEGMDALAHLPPEHHGALGAPSPERAAAIRKIVLESLR